MTNELELTPENALQRLPQRFWSVFTEKLVAIFGDVIFESDADYGAADGFLGVDYITGTCGWNKAIVRACRQTRCEWFYYWYDMLPWYESDEFDCNIVAELKARWKGLA